MSTRLNDVVGYINAGGRGTRLNGVFTPDPNTGIAKALLPIGNPPISLIDHHISNLRLQGVGEIVVAAGDQTSVHEYISGMYHDDSRIYATESQTQLGTGGDLVAYAKQMPDKEKVIIVQNVDTILSLDLAKFHHEFEIKEQLGAVAMISLT